MNTPSGENRTALDKFVLQYVNQGYEWKFENDNILFSKDITKLKATATYNERGWINGYNVHKIKI